MTCSTVLPAQLAGYWPNVLRWLEMEDWHISS